MISIQQMQYIIALNEEKQFQRASEVCFVSQPTLSMQVKKAEEMLGGVLFDRSRFPLELTDFGSEMIVIFQDVLQEFAKIKELVQKKDGAFIEEIRMAIIPTVSGYMLPDLYGQWKDSLPSVQLSIEEMKTEELLIALESRKIDVAILAGPESNLKWRTIPLFQEEIWAYMPNYEGQNIHVDVLKDYHPWLLTQGNCLRTQMVSFCELRGNPSLDDWDYEGGNIGLLENMVEKHGGYTLVPHYFIKKMTDNYKRLSTSDGVHPAREVIALVSNRNPKWKNIEILIRQIQLKYGSIKNTDLRILNWK